MDAEQVESRKDFEEFLAVMRAELHSGADSWENVNLAAFLEAMSAWVHDWQEPFEPNPWKHAAILMQVGAIYE